MKKILLSIAFALLGFSSSFAAKANNAITQVTLTDGTVISARLFGDEHFHYYALLDGTPLEATANGKFKKITVEELQAKQAEDFNVLTRASSIGDSEPKYFSHTGSPKVLVILAQFQDVKFKSKDPVATFNHYLNAEPGESWPAADKETFAANYKNYGSVKQYFKDCSYGQFTPQFDVVGPVTVSQNSSYYGKDTSNSTDARYTEMINEACKLVDDKVNFADYSSNNNAGYVDLVYIIYAGYSQSLSGNSSDCLWPKSGTYTGPTCDGMRISRFGINNELNGTPAVTLEVGKPILNGIGLFCHEFSHTMGLPDLYVTKQSLPAYTANNQSPEDWDLMDGGEYIHNGYCPAPYSPWEKMMMGWMTPETLGADNAQQLSLEPSDNTNSKIYKIEADVDDSNFFVNSNYGKVDESTKKNLMKRAKGEYLLLQNIRKTGWYQYLYGEGLLVWRIDYADLPSVKLFDNPNNTKGIPRVMIVPADGIVINSNNAKTDAEKAEFTKSMATDIFPAKGIGDGDSDINYLKSVTLNWSTQTSRPLYNIARNENTGVVTFDYLKDFTTGIKSPITSLDNEKDTRIFTLDGRYLGTDASNLGKGIYIIGKKKVVIK